MMNISNRQIRLILALVVLVLLLVALAAGLFVTEALLRLWDELTRKPAWFGWLLGLVTAVLAAAAGWVMWRLLMPAKKQPPMIQKRLDEQSLHDDLEKAKQKGIDVSRPQQELHELDQRRQRDNLYIATFGTISSGKSSLIQALLPVSRIETDVRGGTTTTIDHYQWTGPAGDRIVFADVPGSEGLINLDNLAQDEARRAHIVMYVCDGDLNRDQYRAIQSLLTWGKPTIVALNKTDRYTTEELAVIRQNVSQRLHDMAADVQVIGIQTGGREEVVRIDADGNEYIDIRTRAPQVDALKQALMKWVKRTNLVHLRDQAVFQLAHEQLQQSVLDHQQQQAHGIVRSYTRRAVVGALAAVSPGTDIIIQGVLGMSMVKALCKNFDVDVRDVDIDAFLKSAQNHMGKTLPMILAIAGNGLKAFPGLGTLTGGLVHAVAYGIIFDTLGKSLVLTLRHRAASGQSFQIQPAVNQFQEMLHGDLESSARRVAKMAMEEKDQTDQQHPR